MGGRTKINKTGSWQKLNDLTKNLKSALDTGSRKGAEKVAQATLQKMKGHIDKQDLNWPPKKKASKSGSTKSWVDTGELYNSFYIHKENGGKNVSIRVHGKENQMKFMILENGSVKKNIPPRPLVQKSLKEATQEAKRGNLLSRFMRKFLSKFFR